MLPTLSSPQPFRCPSSAPSTVRRERVERRLDPPHAAVRGRRVHPNGLADRLERREADRQPELPERQPPVRRLLEIPVPLVRREPLLCRRQELAEQISVPHEKGQLQLERQEADYIATLELWKNNESREVALRLAGPATCDAGVLRVRFGPGDSTAAPVKVLSGRAEALLQPRLFEQALFGVWSADVLVKGGAERETLEGYFREAPANRPVPIGSAVASGAPDAPSPPPPSLRNDDEAAPPAVRQ
jgi:hypothetical protein